jgi:tetratricopeptide (TPR) repeat protein
MNLDLQIQIESEQNELAGNRQADAWEYCRRARSHEDAGDYEVARAALGTLCGKIGERPSVGAYEPRLQAEILLRVGALTGWVGSARQLEGAQELAKNLISESVSLLFEYGFDAEAADAQIDLAICYWREGAFDEARVMLREVMSRSADAPQQLLARALLNYAIVEFSAKRFQKAAKLLDQAGPLFAASDSHAARGRFHMIRALVLRNLAAGARAEEFLDRALVENTAASFHLKEAGHSRYLARVENNIGFLLYTLGRFAEAHEHLSSARQIFDTLRDKGSIAQVDETRARVFLAEDKNSEAEKAARYALHLLSDGDEQALIAEAMTTHGLALARTGQIDQSYAALLRAAAIAERAGDREGAGRAYLSVVEIHSERLALEDQHETYMRAADLLSRVQHPETHTRLAACRQLIQETIRRSATGRIPLGEGYSLFEDMTRYESEVIARALKMAKGSITRAARLLGITHQALAFMLQGRHQHLLPARTPIRKRQKSLMRKS